MNGKLHRPDGPAIKYPNGYEAWYLNGNFHRPDGPAIKYSDGTEFWCLPAVKHPNGHEFWYLKGKRHRPDGPAFKDPSGHEEWYLNGTKLDENQIKTLKYMQDCPLKELPLYLNTIFKPIVERRLKS